MVADLRCLFVTPRAVSDDASRKKLFEEYVAHLVQKAKEKDRKREKEEKVRHSVIFGWAGAFVLIGYIPKQLRSADFSCG